MTCISAASGALPLIFVFSILAQTPRFPFPQNVNYPGCIKPSAGEAKMVSDIKAKYDSYKSKYLKTAPKTAGGYYSQSGGAGGTAKPAITVSEQHGYAMIIYALMAGYDSNAKTIYDGLYKMWKAHLSTQGGSTSHCMAWYIANDESTQGDMDGAADGDFDVCYSLLLADRQWGSSGAINYLEEAKYFITHGIKGKDVGASSHRTMQGDWTTNQSNTRSSDWFLDHMRAFGLTNASEKTFWDACVTEIYTMYGQVAKPGVGLVSDFVTGNPARADAGCGGNDGEHSCDKYSYNACRDPLRLAVDYAHFGDSRTKNLLTTINNWLKGKIGTDISKIRAGYDLNGNVIGDWEDACFTGPFIAGMICDPSYQAILNAGWTYLNGMSGGNSYTDALRLECLLIISGNWWNPVGTTATPNAPLRREIQKSGRSSGTLFDTNGRKIPGFELRKFRSAQAVQNARNGVFFVSDDTGIRKVVGIN